MAPSTAARTFDTVRAAELLIAAAGGGEESMGALLQECEPFVRGCAQRYAWRREQIDDVVQDVWVQLLLNVTRIREADRLAAWLATVTRNAATRLGRRERRAIPTEEVEGREGTDSAEEDALRRCRRDEVEGGVRRALDRLDHEDRTLLLLLHRDDRPGYRDVGAAVGRPVGSLGPSRQRLLNRMRRDRDIAKLRTLVVAA
jgi:RNA polymerase sigma factor (sigma-70 family)